MESSFGQLKHIVRPAFSDCHLILQYSKATGQSNKHWREHMFKFLSANKQLVSLQLGLSEFGLKPVDWRVVKKTKSRFVIQSLTAEDFYFIGEVKSSNDSQWQFIRVAGL